jgi:hypothetical protein
VDPEFMRGLIALLIVCGLWALPSAVAEERVSFNRDIRPIMSDTCFHCHGNDAKTREAGLRLDRRDDALKETEGGVVPIVPGDPDASEIVKRIFDAENPMPPESAHTPLTDAHLPSTPLFGRARRRDVHAEES